MHLRAFTTLAMIPTAAAAAIPQQAPAGWSPAAIEWGEAAPDGTRYTLLEGVRDRAGVPFSYAFFIPAGSWDAPHFHSATARIFVVRGVLRIGYGASADRDAAQAYPAGSYLVVPAGAVHYDGAAEDTTIIGTAIGPWSTTYLDATGPASAGTPEGE
ncbi:cupin domain-containing protein [Stenotrophomonas sp. MMGLT7]|uniref:cupin domain-containing protein n=1 Tax=Stenotrophomonas sp. MMGLT7 TaxID=2901227 RepID=UPI001E386392|nr:cupin domain-containing protein [Stenotrophomonas sp. MMGLT7]MCD7097865.1 cupin domain-containing protein [Stenotrophomonas sp. MMGLT7]